MAGEARQRATWGGWERAERTRRRSVGYRPRGADATKECGPPPAQSGRDEGMWATARAERTRRRNVGYHARRARSARYLRGRSTGRVWSAPSLHHHRRQRAAVGGGARGGGPGRDISALLLDVWVMRVWVGWDVQGRQEVPVQECRSGEAFTPEIGWPGRGWGRHLLSTLHVPASSCAPSASDRTQPTARPNRTDRTAGPGGAGAGWVRGVDGGIGADLRDLGHQLGSSDRLCRVRGPWYLSEVAAIPPSARGPHTGRGGRGPDIADPRPPQAVSGQPIRPPTRTRHVGGGSVRICGTWDTSLGSSDRLCPVRGPWYLSEVAAIPPSAGGPHTGRGGRGPDIADPRPPQAVSGQRIRPPTRTRHVGHHPHIGQESRYFLCQHPRRCPNLREVVGRRSTESMRSHSASLTVQDS